MRFIETLSAINRIYKMRKIESLWLQWIKYGGAHVRE